MRRRRWREASTRPAPAAPSSAIGRAVEAEVERQGFRVLRELTGHGIGRTIHEPPTVHNHDRAGRRRGVLDEGTVITIEPIISTTTRSARMLADGWTVATVDGSRSAHAEHTIVDLPRRPAGTHCRLIGVEREDWDLEYGRPDRATSGRPGRLLVDAVDGLPPGRALDLACGDGRNAAWLAEHGWRVTAVDFSAEALRRAHELAADVEWREGDVRDVAIDAGAFDLVVLAYLHLPPEAMRADAGPGGGGRRARAGGWSSSATTSTTPSTAAAGRATTRCCTTRPGSAACWTGSSSSGRSGSRTRRRRSTEARARRSTHWSLRENRPA